VSLRLSSRKSLPRRHFPERDDRVVLELDLLTTAGGPDSTLLTRLVRAAAIGHVPPPFAVQRLPTSGALRHLPSPVVEMGVSFLSSAGQVELPTNDVVPKSEPLLHVRVCVWSNC